MRNYKIVAVLMAAVFMLASLQGITVQAESIGVEAQACKVLGLLQGDGANGVTVEYLNTNPTRLQTYIIALKLKGLYNEAGKYTSNNNFADVSLAEWAKNYLAYAKNTPELGWTGYPDGRFGVDDKINGQAFYKVMLEVLGYKQNVDFTYEQTLEFAEKIGLVGDAAEIKSIQSFTTNDLAKGIYRALNTNVSSTENKLADFLVDKGIFKKEKVEAAGLNSLILITPMIDSKYKAAWVPIRDTYSKMGCYILENSKNNTSYEIKKGLDRVRFTEGFTTAYINNTKVTMEQAVMKGDDGVYYVPVSFVVQSAEELGYDAEYAKEKNILRLQVSAAIKSTQSDIVLTKGSKKSLMVQKIQSDIDKEVVTNQCTFTAMNNDGIIELESTTGEITGKNIGAVEIVINYQGKEVDRVNVHVVELVPKYYPAAYYEQVFETTFKIDKSNFTDGFGVVWNKAPGAMITIKEGDCIDTGSSLNILNYSANDAGMIANVTKLLEDRGIKGKTSILKIYAKGISKNSKLYLKADIRTNSAILKQENSIVLGDKWKNIELLKLELPEDTKELILTIAAGQNEEIRIDAFTMTMN